MNPETADVLKAACYSLAAAGGAAAVAKYYWGYLREKVDNETFAERVRVLKDMLANVGFQTYLTQRREIASSIVGKDFTGGITTPAVGTNPETFALKNQGQKQEAFFSGINKQEKLRRTIDAVVGDLLPDFRDLK